MSTCDGTQITDPITVKPSSYWLARPFRAWVRETGDMPFVQLSLLMLVVFIPAAVYLFLPNTFRWWMAPIYWAAYLYFIGPFILMLHNTSHRPLFKAKHVLLNKIIPWLNGPLVGQSPETYFAHHLGMHHAEGNLPRDLSSTMPYQRDSFLHFLMYYTRFLYCHPALLRYYRDVNRPNMYKRFVVGEFFQVTLTAGMLLVNWQAALVVFVVPMFTTRFFLMSGNWAQHAFIDPDDPTNDYKTVTTFINSAYNHRCFNDGYHLGHHLKPARHWLEMPGDFLAKRKQMADAGALVFEKIDYFMIFLLLVFKRYKVLAKYHVNITDKEVTTNEIVALIKKRVRRFSPEQLEAIANPPTAHEQEAVAVAN